MKLHLVNVLLNDRLYAIALCNKVINGETDLFTHSKAFFNNYQDIKCNDCKIQLKKVK